METVGNFRPSDWSFIVIVSFADSKFTDFLNSNDYFSGLLLYPFKFVGATTPRPWSFFQATIAGSFLFFSFHYKGSWPPFFGDLDCSGDE